MVGFAFDNSYARELPGFHVPWQPEAVENPALLYLNHDLAEELRLSLRSDDAPSLADIFSGKRLPAGASPIAQVYAGHQFGRFSPQLGDGRALLIGELIDCHGQRRDLAFKGSGPTPFSRGGDGKAAVGPMLREVLIGEAMHALGIPTTRALAVVSTGETVHREQPLPGAILTRVAASHIRIGTFEYFAARGDAARVRQLADYAIARHDPGLTDGKERYPAFLRAVMLRQAALIGQWMGVGFIHGVMNTDNMSIAGETIDYGPCAFMETYDPDTVFSSIDHHGRYAYGNQHLIAQWNLSRLAQSLLPLLADDRQRAVDVATEIIDAFPHAYQQCWLKGMRAKLGLTGQDDDGDRIDTALAEDWLALLQAHRIDFTLAWRRLADAAAGDATPLRELFADHPALHAWLTRWRTRCADEDAAKKSDTADRSGMARAQAMRRVSPWLIPRNHRVEEALAAATDHGNLKPFRDLLAALERPFEEQPHLARYAEPAPATFTASYQTFCGT